MGVRLDPFPAHVMHSFSNASDDVYQIMRGPEWHVTGNLKDWDVTARLGKPDRYRHVLGSFLDQVEARKHR
jgi:hypothetical protein